MREQSGREEEREGRGDFRKNHLHNLYKSALPPARTISTDGRDRIQLAFKLKSDVYALFESHARV